ncbi:MAG: hypothetical protein GXZ04_05630 [Clostridiales bacterium]|nr:hypothetical protein [Clostridiales bacterium]
MRAHGDSILKLCFVYLHDLHLAEDAMQETFLKAWRAYARFRGDSSPLTWLSRIAINVCKDLHKSAWQRHVNLALSLDSLPEPSTPAFEADDTLITSVMALPTVYRRLNKAQDILRTELEGWYYET